MAAKTRGLFARVREKRLQPKIWPGVPWHPADAPLFRFDLSTYKGGGWVPHPHKPGVLVQYWDGGFR